MKHDEERTSFADSLPDANADIAAEGRHPTIAGWSVVGYDRIVGTVYGHRGAASGKTIITSPVLQVLLEGDPPSPVARTQSGSLYALATPSAALGPERAEHFLQFKSRPPVGDAVSPVAPQMRTTLLKLEP